MNSNINTSETRAPKMIKSQNNSIQNSSLDLIRSVPILEIIQNEIKLKKKGANYLGLCPFHNENTPSFTVSEGKGLYKCFGCGAVGDGIKFIREFHKLDFKEACEHISKNHNIDFQWEKMTENQYNENREKQEILLFHKIAADWYQEQLQADDEALKYASQRINNENIEIFQVGFAPGGWNTMFEAMLKKGYTKEFLLKTKLYTQKDDRVFDFFQNRIMFPIHDYKGNIIGFGGRTLDGSQPKYINSPESEIFDKSKNLYGLYFAKDHIKNGDPLYITEGYTDVTSLLEAGIKTTVGLLGTALTENHLKIIKRFTGSVILCMDNDNAGRKSMMRSAELLLKAGLKVSVTTNLPLNSDPDKFFRDGKNTLENENFLTWLAEELFGNSGFEPEKRSDALREMGRWLNLLPDIEQNAMVDYLTTNYKKQKITTKTITAVIAAARESNGSDKNEITKKRTKTNNYDIPENISAIDFERFGFYEKNNQLYFRTNKGIQRGANFVLKPLYHIKNHTEAKRLFLITNEFAENEIIELHQRDLISLPAFKLKVESLGNYLWELRETELNKLKRFLYENTPTCNEVTQLGWQRQGFFAFSNGIISENIFKPVNKYGIVTHTEESFFIAEGSEIVNHTDDKHKDRTKFKFKNGNSTITEYIDILVNVFGDKGMIGFAFVASSLFRDVIQRKFGFFPLLNLFGPKSTGKTEFSVALASLFGNLGKGLNITSATNPSLADHVASYSNAVSVLEEFKNHLEPEKVEFLKGLWDGTGRSRMNLDKKKKETSSVDSGVILTGQQIPTQDIALFSRVIFLQFFKSTYSDSEKQKFAELKGILDQGLGQIVLEILKHRQYFIDNYFQVYETVVQKFMEDMPKITTVDDRVFRNYCVIAAGFFTLAAKINTNITVADMTKMCIKLITDQSKLTLQTDERANFWETFEHMVREGLIHIDKDYRLEDKTREKLRKDGEEIDWKADPEGTPCKLLYIHHTGIIMKYIEYSARIREKPLPKDSLMTYLTSSLQYLGTKRQYAFKKDIHASRRDFITTAFVFDYNKLNKSYDLNIDILNDEESIDLP